MKTKLITFLLIAVAAFTMTLTGCQKDPQPDQRKPITIKVNTAGLIVKPITKSFNPSQWIFNYNPNPYTLTFAGSQGQIYTFSKTIAELQAGFTITVLPDTYTVTYLTTHIPFIEYDNTLSQTLDISINESQAVTNNTPITLTGHNEDYLLIFDINEIQSAQVMNNQTNWMTAFSIPNEVYKWAYWNQEGSIDVRYTFFNSQTGSNQTINKTINVAKNNIYHFVSNANGTTSVNILQMDYNLIGW